MKVVCHLAFVIWVLFAWGCRDSVQQPAVHEAAEVPPTIEAAADSFTFDPRWFGNAEMARIGRLNGYSMVRFESGRNRLLVVGGDSEIAGEVGWEKKAWLEVNVMGASAELLAETDTVVHCLDETGDECTYYIFHEGKLIGRADVFICEVAAKIDKYINRIRKEPEIVVRPRMDNCVLAVLDTISNSAMVKEDEKYLKGLDAIASVSDGYVEEYIIELAVRQLHQNFDRLIGHMVADSQYCPLREYLILGIGMDMSQGVREEAALNTYLDSMASAPNTSPAEAACLAKLRAEIDLGLFD